MINRLRSSRSLAATLSFLVPGLGQLMYGQIAWAMFFLAPIIALALLILATMPTSPIAFVARLLDPTVALVAMIVLLQLGAWRLFAVLHAAGEGQRTGRGLTERSLSRAPRALTLVLVLVIVASHVYAVGTLSSMRSAGEQIFGGQPLPTPSPTIVPGDTDGDGTVDPGEVSPSTNPHDLDGDGDVDAEDGDLNGDGLVDDRDDPFTPGLPEGPPLGSTDDDMLNVLILGRRGSLTDTIMVVSANLKTGKVVMISVPRDISDVPLSIGGRFGDRINAMYKWINRHPELYPAGGAAGLMREIGYLVGIPIDHYAEINIDGFHSLIEIVGGVHINNTRDISDPHLRVSETEVGFYLPVGPHFLDADHAQAYVRSRHSGGSDYLRARRQQEVLIALRDELLRPERLLQLPQLAAAGGALVRSDVQPGQLAELIEIVQSVDSDPSANIVLKNPYSYHPPMSETNGRWILRPVMDEIARLSVELFGDKSRYSRR